MNTATSTPIIQFGTSRFLQAHADLFVDEAQRDGRAAGPITVVQSSGDPARAARLSALAAPGGYPVRIRGLEDGRIIDRVQQVSSVTRTMSTATGWAALEKVFCEEAEFVLSNTGDRGFAPQPADEQPEFEQAMAYPAKLQLLLRARFDSSGRPLTVLPLELVRRNGRVLQARVLELAAGAPEAYREWLANDVIWANSLVDRIVSEPIEPAGAVAEPYALWAIEKAEGLIPPCRHPAVQLVEDLDAIEALKLFILNLGHTWLVSEWQQMHRPPDTVAALLDQQEVCDGLLRVYEDEVLPAFAVAGLGDEAAAYVETTLQRYRNPFLDHLLSDIAQNHAEKVARRIGGFLEWANDNGDTTRKPLLTGLFQEMKTDA